MESTVLKTIAGFLNTTGGTLVVGVADDGTPVGLAADGFPSEDKMALHVINLLKERMGGQHAINVHLRFDDHAKVRVLTIECDKSKTPVFVKDGAAERFFVRYGPSTQELTGATAQAFIQQRFQ
jgi:predicted HTH transcriptional regulator